MYMANTAAEQGALWLAIMYMARTAAEQGALVGWDGQHRRPVARPVALAGALERVGHSNGLLSVMAKQTPQAEVRGCAIMDTFNLREECNVVASGTL